MPTRANPFYRYQTPAGQTLSGLAGAMFPDQSVNAVRESAAVENMAQARASDALAGYRTEQTRGERDANNAMMAAPNSLAELILSGGVLKDDPLRTNPDFKAPAPIDWSTIFSNPGQINSPIASPILSGATAQDKMASAIQEAAIRNLKLDDVLKAAGINEFQRRAGGASPDSALAFAPFAGVTSPNQNTAFTTTRQDAISARDAQEDQAKQDTVNATGLERERIQQGGANARNKYSVDNRPVSAGNNTDVVVTPAQGKAMGIQPNEQGQYVVRGRTTVGTGQDQQPGSLGGDAVAGRDRPAGGKGGAGKPLRFEKSQIETVNKMIQSGGDKLGTTMPLATRDLIRDNAAKLYRDPNAPEYGDLANATARSMREFWGDPTQASPGIFSGKVLVPQSVIASMRKALDAGVDADKAYSTIAQRTGYTRKQIEAALNAQQSAR